MYLYFSKPVNLPKQLIMAMDVLNLLLSNGDKINPIVLRLSR